MDLIVGGIEESQSLPLELFSGTLRHGYVGCIRNMAMNGETLDLPEYVEEQSQDGNIVRFCREEEPLCTSDPCQHGGNCKEGWNRFICDCRKTGYTGETCKDGETSLFHSYSLFCLVTIVMLFDFRSALKITLIYMINLFVG